ncbi:MAG TPA: phytoene/squalene synthase family protein [Ktedonobacteraceae bacterium]|nr:phytoene/squalene synthase family protein [Ktedonobacteraceae bacterium]
MRMVEIGKKDSGSIEPAGGQYQAGILAQQWLATSSRSDEWLLATHGRTFHFAARFLPPKYRQLVVTLYAFFRTLDDLVDKPVEGCRLEDIRLELDAWKGWFTGGSLLPAPREPLGGRLASVLSEHPVPIAIFLDFLDGLATDLEPREMRDFSELYHYCYRVAGTVGLAMAYILGVKSSQGLAAAQSLGIGMQLTNILRDIGGDLAAGRIYLPQEDLARFGSSRAHLVQLYEDQHGPDDRFRALMRYQIARAQCYYIHGMPGIWLLPRSCRLPILVAGRLYRRILRAIERKHYDVLRSRAATSFSEKVWEAAIAFTLDQLWSRGEHTGSTEVEVVFED